MGLNERRPASANAVTISGLAMKFIVEGLASLRAGKLRLNDVTMELTSPGLMVGRFHWPMQGPQAFAMTLAPTDSSAAIWPSRWIVALTASEPGVTRKSTAAPTPCSAACRATLAARETSSYEELVQEPMRVAESRSG